MGGSIAVVSPHAGARRRGKEKGWEIIPYIRRGRLLECKNKRFYKQPHVWWRRTTGGTRFRCRDKGRKRTPQK